MLLINHNASSTLAARPKEYDTNTQTQKSHTGMKKGGCKEIKLSRLFRIISRFFDVSKTRVAGEVEERIN